MSAIRGLLQNRFRARLIALVAAIVVSSVLAVGAAALAAFERAVGPELANRTQLIGTIVRAEIEQALELGIPFDEISGLERHLTETQRRFQEVDRIFVHSASGALVAATMRGRTAAAGVQTTLGETLSFGQASVTLPILSGNQVVGEITIDTNPQFVRTRLLDVFFDVLVISLIATVTALELALAVSLVSVGRPMQRVLHLLTAQRAGDFRHRVEPGGVGSLARTVARFNDHAVDLAERLSVLPASQRAALSSAGDLRIADGRPALRRLSEIADMRLALFLFSVATEIASAFLPLYARAADRPEWLSPAIAAAAPLLCYLLGVAAISPFGGALARRFGARRLFLVAVPPTVLALCAMGLSTSVTAITAWRSLLALCYALATIACHEYALRAAPHSGSARPITAFLCVIYGGVFCGSALGGLLAGRFGFTAAFFAGGLIAALAGIVGLLSMGGDAGDPAAAPPATAAVPSQDGRPGLRFGVLLLGIAIPMNATTAIFIWYLTPLMLSAAGSGPSEIARVVMLYYLAVVIFAPAVAGLSDGRTGPAPLIIVGAAAAGAALLGVASAQGFWTITATVAALGVGHTLIRAPLYALTQSITRGAPSALALLRLLERVGAILGLGATALLLQGSDTHGDILRGLGIAVLAGAAAYAMLEIIGRRPSA